MVCTLAEKQQVFARGPDAKIFESDAATLEKVVELCHSSA
jgi:hypothetical protein